MNTEHGVLPVPAPATARLLRERAGLRARPGDGTDHAHRRRRRRHACERFGALPPMKIARIGYGAGDRDFPEQANVLRVMVGEAHRRRGSAQPSP